MVDSGRGGSRRGNLHARKKKKCFESTLWDSTVVDEMSAPQTSRVHHWSWSMCAFYTLMVTFRIFCWLLYRGFQIKMWSYFWNTMWIYRSVLGETLHSSFVTDALLILLSFLHFFNENPYSETAKAISERWYSVICLTSNDGVSWECSHSESVW